MRVAAAAVVFGAVVALVDYELGAYNQFVIARIAVLVLVTLSLNVLIGVTGLLSLASAAFMGTGAFGILIVLQHTGIPLLAGIPLVVAGTWIVGWVLGTASLRLSGFYLALVTLGFLVAFQVVVQHGGTTVGEGYGLLAPQPDVFGWTANIKWVAVACVFVAGAASVFVWSLLNSRLGRAWRTLKANPVAAELSGMNLTRLKTSAFAFSAAVAGLAGTCYAFLEQAVSPQGFDINRTIDHLAYVVVGGAGSTLGSILGPLVLELLPEYLRSLQQYRQLFLGAVLLGILILAPRGLAGLLQDIFGRFAPRLVRRAQVLVERTLDVAPRAGEEPAQLRPRRAAAQTEEKHPAVLEFRNVTVRYGGLTAVRDLSFAVNRGEIHGLIGPNGAGKTTAINALSGLVGVAEGAIAVNGQLIRTYKKGVPSWKLARHGVARTFQTPLVVPELSALDNVVAGLHSQLRSGLVTGALKPGFVRREERAARSRALEALQRIRFGGDPLAPVRTLGFGELRRVEIARAIVGRPQLLLLDEPTSGLELDAAVATLEELRIMQSESDHSLTVLIVEHNVPLLFTHCETVTAMIEGHAVITGTPDAVRRDPQVRSSYLGDQLLVEEAGHEQQPEVTRAPAQ
jgi:ABC-type branched-subunit amino acid transport system ATPase component/ABC-type branched-subunit amino acid transport system permease subunit